ncbi:flagellar biosynthesis protein FlhF [Sporolactobacillus sp. THM7-4]|nr:flagellar biosynthesis protein FlhF [Sporolactobacillus sp. THM7-4]
MKMKKIIAPTMAQAINKVKEELGNDAIIFHTKKVTNGHFFNLFKKESVEVLAASDPDQEFSLKNLSVKPEKKKERFSQKDRLPGLLPHRVSDKVDRLFLGPACIKKFQNRLSEQGMADQHIVQVLKILVRKWYQSDEKLTEREMAGLLKAQLVRKLDPLRFQSPPRRYIMLVGPTGVGKTTTIAKWAGHAVLNEGKKIAFITSDTFRIAAIDQLKMYAGILRVPVEAAYNEQDLHSFIQKFSSFDHVFIDTAGRNFQLPEYIDESKRMIESDDQIEPYLVVSATAKFEDIQELMDQFKALPVHKLIISKVDETRTYGAILSTLINHPDKRVAYITNGQNVPDDFQPADVHDLVHRTLGDLDDE